jgi:hypothetical protein
MACYTLIKIDKPFVFTKKEKDKFHYKHYERTLLDNFLAIGPNKEGLYFCYNKITKTTEPSYEIKINFIDFN